MCVFTSSVLYKGNLHKQHLLCKNLAENSKTPPTTGSLEEHIVHVQAVAWTIMKHHLLDPLEHGQYRDSCGDVLPITTKIPQSTIELIRCQLKTYYKSQHCSCRRHRFTCTELCLCGTDYENNADLNIYEEGRQRGRSLGGSRWIQQILLSLDHVIHFNELL